MNCTVLLLHGIGCTEDYIYSVVKRYHDTGFNKIVLSAYDSNIQHPDRFEGICKVILIRTYSDVSAIKTDNFVRDGRNRVYINKEELTTPVSTYGCIQPAIATVYNGFKLIEEHYPKTKYVFRLRYDMYVFDIGKVVRKFKQIVKNNRSIKPFKHQMITTGKSALWVNDFMFFGLYLDIRRFYDNCLRLNTNISNIGSGGQEKSYIISNACNIYNNNRKRPLVQRNYKPYAKKFTAACFTSVAVNFYWNKHVTNKRRIRKYMGKVLKINDKWVGYNKKYYARVKREIDHDIVPCKLPIISKIGI